MASLKKYSATPFGLVYSPGGTLCDVAFALESASAEGKKADICASRGILLSSWAAATLESQVLVERSHLEALMYGTTSSPADTSGEAA